MIKQMRASYFHNFKNAQYCALSDDPIPDDLENGDEVYIIDQGKIYYWDESSSSLYEYKGGGGSGGSSSFIPCFGSLATVSLGTTWSGDDPYVSTVTVTGYTVTTQTMVSVLPSSDVVDQMLADGITNIFITNNDGVLTATAIGATPTVPMTLQVLCTESNISGDIAELPSIVGSGIIETVEADNLTDAVNILGEDVSDLKNAIDQKQDAPSTAGTAGQVLGLNNSLQPVWVNQSGGGGDVSNCAPIIINTASGDIASFADGANNRQIRKIVGTIVTPEGGSGCTGANIYNYPRYNQLRRDDSATKTAFGVTTAYNSTTHLVTITNDSRTTNYSTGADQVILSVNDFEKGHKYAFIGPQENGVTISGFSSVGDIYTATIQGFGIYLRITSSYDFVNRHPVGDVYSFPLTIVDMTEMFGDAADTITYEEVATMFPQNYYPYKAIDSTAQSGGTTLLINWQSEAGTILNGTVTLNEDGSADVVNSDTTDSYHLTGIGNVSTYFGVNNVWIDTGAITECDYPADTKLYVDGLTAPDEDMIANANITSGKYFVVNNQLYLSTAAIAAGASIVPGTNCTATNLAEALNALNT